MNTIKDKSGDVKVTRRHGYWLIEQDMDVISLTDESMAALIDEYIDDNFYNEAEK